MQQIIIHLPAPLRPGWALLIVGGVPIGTLVAREVIETTGEEVPETATGYLRLLPGGRAA